MISLLFHRSQAFSPRSVWRSIDFRVPKDPEDEGCQGPFVGCGHREDKERSLMPNLLVITGTCGVGKSSVSRLWATRRCGAAISGDAIRYWIRDQNLRAARNFQDQLVVRTAVTAAQELLAQNLDVALDNVWFPPAMQLLKQALSPAAVMRFVWLQCGETENHRRDQLRSTGDVMGQRVDELRRELESQIWPDYVHMLDTSSFSCEETVQRVESLPTL